MKNAIIGFLSGYSITTLPVWVVKDNLWAVGALSAIIVWCIADKFDEYYKKWRECHGDKTFKLGINRLQRGRTKKV